jgi:hypothetical protein
MAPDEPTTGPFAGSEPDDCLDLMEAAQSALGFWNNPADDADWNNVPTERDRRLDETRSRPNR